jgi:hypothetical protein
LKLAVKRADLFGCFAKRRYRHIHCKNAFDFKAGLRRLQRDQCLQEHPRSRQEDKGCCYLDYGKHVQSSFRRAGNSDTAAR